MTGWAREWLFCALSSLFFGCSYAAPHTPSPGVFAPEAMSQAKFINVKIYTFLYNNLWNLAPQTFALLHIQYKITQNILNSSTLKLDQKLRDDALYI